jgi:hypothetical protein
MAWKSLVVIISAVTVIGCASSSKEIKAAYVSPIQYDEYSCDQLVSESRRIQQRVSEAGGAVDERASGDSVKMGVGLVLFWPTLFFLKGDGPEAQEFARLKGEHEAIQQAYNLKNCGRDGNDGQ